MERNVGSLDRGVRIVLGLGTLGAGIYFKSWWGLLGIVPLTTAAIRCCPAYLPFGIRTCAGPTAGKPGH